MKDMLFFPVSTVGGTKKNGNHHHQKKTQGAL